MSMVIHGAVIVAIVMKRRVKRMRKMMSSEIFERVRWNHLIALYLAVLLILHSTIPELILWLKLSLSLLWTGCLVGIILLIGERNLNRYY